MAKADTSRTKKPAAKKKTPPRGRKASSAAKGRRRPSPISAPPPEVEAPAPSEVEAPLPEVHAPRDQMEIAVGAPPEVAFAARMPAQEPERPRPSRRRAIFFDVENTSRLSVVEKMLAHVAIDRSQAVTELVASGNWRVIGNETARLLASHGAHLVHSAPATGVRDWSDLRIAVAAGAWLASARPGDELDIVSDDKAFDVVGDVAATLGVRFRRLSYRAILGHRHEAAPAAAAAPAREPGGRRGGRSRRGGGRSAAPRHAPAQAPHAPATPPPAPISTVETVETPAPAETTTLVEPAAPAEAPETTAPSGGTPHAAPVDQLRAVVNELLERSPQGVMLDTIANKLKAMGFERPPGSPRLVVRLRQIRDLDVSPRGLVKLKGASAPSQEAAPEGEAGATAAPPAERNPGSGGSGRRRRRRGGGGGGGGGQRGGNPPPAPPAV